MFQRTLVMIKPDSSLRGITGKIISHYEKSGLNVLELATVTTTKELLESHYEEHKESEHFADLINSMLLMEVKVLIIEGYDSISRVRHLNGATDPMKADRDSIRGKYGCSYRYNCVHASDSVESANREIKLWFGEKYLL